MDWLTTQTIVALVMLTLLEIVLGIDNIVFISVLTDKLPKAERARATFIGLSAALGIRVLLLLGIKWVMKLDETLFSVVDHDISIKGLILIAGGGFLIAKATHEIHVAVEGKNKHGDGKKATVSGVIMQIIILDVIFSIDSVITAVGMADDLWVMITAVVISMMVMMYFAAPLGSFVQRHPAMKVLALAFLVLIGVALVAEGMHVKMPKGYIYSAMGFALMVELLQLRMSNNKSKKLAKKQAS